MGAEPTPPDDLVDAHDPPTPARVARRALALAMVTFRGVVEVDAVDPGAVELWREARAWCGELGLDDELEPDERRIIAAPIGSLPMQRTIEVTWRAEGLVVLAYALGVVELPGLVEKCDPAAVANALGFLAPRDGTALAAPGLRPYEQLEQLTDAYRMLHWRLRHHASGKGPYHFAGLVANSACAEVVAERLELVDGDLALQGVPLTRADPDAVSNARSLVLERHTALEWLLGQHPEYSAIETDT